MNKRILAALMATLWLFSWPVTLSARSSMATSPPVKAIPALTYGFILLENGRVMAWGQNGDGQLGLGDTLARYVPVLIPNLFCVRDIFIYQNSVFAVKTDGSVMVWGDNASNKLKLGISGDVLTPSVNSIFSDVVSFAFSTSHGLVLYGNGSIQGWGRNSFGQIGLGYASMSVNDPAWITSLAGVSRIAVSRDSSFALMNDGSVFSWGLNTSGELGLGNSGAGTHRYSPSRINGIEPMASIAAGNSHVLALTYGQGDGLGSVYAWGANSSGQIGQDPQNVQPIVSTPSTAYGMQGIVQIAAALNTSFAVSSTGSIWCWGSNANYLLGTGDATSKTYRVPTSQSHLLHASSVFLSAQTGYALFPDNTVMAWGNNGAYQLGLGDTAVRSIPALMMESEVPPTAVATGDISADANVQILGSASPMILSVTHPAVLSWSIDPNEANPFYSTSFTVTNHSKCPVDVSVTSFEKHVESGSDLEDAAPDSFSDWSALTKVQSESNIALGIRILENGSAWMPGFLMNARWTTDLGTTWFGALGENASGLFELTSHHGLSFSSDLQVQHVLVFLFTLH